MIKLESRFEGIFLAEFLYAFSGSLLIDAGKANSVSTCVHFFDLAR